MMTGRRNDEIEVLRAVAVLLVIFEHINALLTWRTYNFEDYVYTYGGVDLFFCISGFVITSGFGGEISAAAKLGGRRFYNAVLAFWVRRVYRIIPLSWTMLLVNFVVFQIIAGHPYWGSLADSIAVIFDVENFHYAYCAQHPSIYCGPDGIFWSVSLEEQFYLLFPFLFLLPRRLMSLLLIATVIFFALVPRTTWVWLTRLDAIALGVLLAMIRDGVAYRALEPKLLAYRLFRMAAFAALLIALVVTPAAGGLATVYPSLVSLIALGLVFVASYDCNYLMAPGVTRSVLVWIGQRSFALYLMHNTVFWITIALFARFWPKAQHGAMLAWSMIAVATIILLVWSDLSFRLFETPIRRRGKVVAARIAERGTVPAIDAATAF